MPSDLPGSSDFSSSPESSSSPTPSLSQNLEGNSNSEAGLSSKGVNSKGEPAFRRKMSSGEVGRRAVRARRLHMPELKSDTAVPKQIPIEGEDVPVGGAYGNAVLVRSSAEDLVIDFIQIMPDASQGELQSRVALSHKTATRLLHALSDHLPSSSLSEDDLPESGLPESGLSESSLSESDRSGSETNEDKGKTVLKKTPGLKEMPRFRGAPSKNRFAKDSLTKGGSEKGPSGKQDRSEIDPTGDSSTKDSSVENSAGGDKTRQPRRTPMPEPVVEPKVLTATFLSSGEPIFCNDPWRSILGTSEKPWAHLEETDAKIAQSAVRRAREGELVTNKLVSVNTGHREEPYPVLINFIPVREKGRESSSNCPVTACGEILAEPPSWMPSQTKRDRVQTLGRMTMGVAHDLNNLLSILLGHAEVLQKEIKEGIENTSPTEASSVEASSAEASSAEAPFVKGVPSSLQKIETAARDGASLIEKLQRYVREDNQHHFEHIDISSLVKKCITLTRPYWHNEPRREGIEISVETDLQDVPPMLGAPNEIREVVVNLILNATQAMPEGGTLHFQVFEEKELICLSVRDTGVGMREEVQEHIFEPLFTTKGEDGTGMGLAAVYGTIQKHEGKIDVFSKPGEGTEFILQFPLAENAGLENTGPENTGIEDEKAIQLSGNVSEERLQEKEQISVEGQTAEEQTAEEQTAEEQTAEEQNAEEQTAEEQPEKKLPAGEKEGEDSASFGSMSLESTSSKSIKVLLVDDEEMVRSTGRRLLGLDGYEVEEAGSGKEALEVFSSEEHDILFTDFGMPGMTGGELAGKIKDKAPSVPVILVTGHTKTDVNQGAVDGVISKPFDRAQLRSTIQRHLPPQS